MWGQASTGSNTTLRESHQAQLAPAPSLEGISTSPILESYQKSGDGPLHNSVLEKLH